MKRSQPLVVVVVAVLVSSSLFAIVGAADSHVSIELDGPSTADAGETVGIDVRMTAETAVYGVQFQVTSSTPITGSVRQGQFLGEGVSSVVLVNGVSQTEIEYGETRTGAEDGVTGEGTLATLELTVPASTDASQVNLSFAIVKVSDPSGTPVETATQGMRINVEATDAGGNGGGSGGSSENGAAKEGRETTAVAETAAERTTSGIPALSAEWPATVSSSVVQQFESQSRVRVVVSVNSSTSLSAFADRLEANGAQQVERHDQVDSVSAVVTAETLRTVARDSAVTTVRHDSSVESTVSASGTSGTAAPAGETGTAPGTEQAAVVSPAETGERSSAFGVSHGPVTAVGVVVVVALLWWRLR